MKFFVILLTEIFPFAFGHFNMFENCPNFNPSRDIFIENVMKKTQEKDQ